MLSNTHFNFFSVFFGVFNKVLQKIYEMNNRHLGEISFSLPVPHNQSRTQRVNTSFEVTSFILNFFFFFGLGLGLGLGLVFDICW